MASIPNYAAQTIQIEGSMPEAPQTSTAMINEEGMVFGAWNANNPATAYMFSAINSVMNSAGKMIEDFEDLRKAKEERRRRGELHEAKLEYSKAMGSTEAELGLLESGYGGAGSIGGQEGGAGSFFGSSWWEDLFR